MSTPRAKTIQARFGFQDSDLKTPEHDQIMLWLDSEIIRIVEGLTGYKKDWSKDAIGKQMARLYTAMGKAITDDPECIEGREWAENFTMPDPPPKPPSSDMIEEKKWEVPVGTGDRNKYIVGFIDFVALIFPPPFLTIGGLCAFEEDGFRKEVHFGFRSPSKYTDYTGPPKLHWKVERKSMTRMNFEVKSSIKSLGELIRQVRMYQEYTRGKFVIVSPDDRFKEPLNKQGIGFVKYEPINSQISLFDSNA